MLNPDSRDYGHGSVKEDEWNEEGISSGQGYDCLSELFGNVIVFTKNPGAD